MTSDPAKPCIDRAELHPLSRASPESPEHAEFQPQRKKQWNSGGGTRTKSAVQHTDVFFFQFQPKILPLLNDATNIAPRQAKSWKENINA